SAASGQNTASPIEPKAQTPASQNDSTSQASGHDQANGSASLTESAPEATATTTQVPYAAQVKKLHEKAAEDVTDEDATAEPTRLRGDASRVVQNMEATLEV